MQLHMSASVATLQLFLWLVISDSEVQTENLSPEDISRCAFEYVARFYWKGLKLFHSFGQFPLAVKYLLYTK